MTSTLPYNGDIQEAMKNKDRGAIKILMQAHSEKSSITLNIKKQRTIPSTLEYINSSGYRKHQIKRKLKIKLQNNQMNNCAICLESLKGTEEHLFVTSCNHRFHRSCIEQHKKTSNKCCLCREVICAAPPLWHEKYMNQPGFWWLTDLINRRIVEREFEEMMDVVNTSNELSDMDSDNSSSYSDYFS